MSKNTWIIVAAALALTASIVVGKSWTLQKMAGVLPLNALSQPAPEVAQPEPPMAVSPILVMAEPQIIEDVTEEDYPCELDVEEQVDPNEDGWTVTVVHGTRVETVHYGDARDKRFVP